MPNEKKDSRWDREQTMLLIRHYEMFPELWDSTSPYHRDREKKTKAVREIAHFLNLPITEISRKLHNLRCQMNSEIRKVKSKSYVGHGTDAGYKSKWEFFDALSFVCGSHNTNETIERANNHVDARLSTTNGTKTEQQVSEQFEEPDALSRFTRRSTQMEVQSTKKKRKLDNQEMVPVSEAISGNKPVDEYTVFAEFVASELRQLHSEERRRRLKRNIQKVIIAMGEEEEYELSTGTSLAQTATEPSSDFVICDYKTLI